MDPASPTSQGLFLGDTRFLSTFQILLNDVPPVLLGSSEEVMFEASYLLTNPLLTDIPPQGIGILQKNSIETRHVRMEMTIANWSLRAVGLTLAIRLNADFFDSFEARGVKRMRRGKLLPPKVTDTGVRLEYVGLDDVTRVTHIQTSPSMDRFEDDCAHFPLRIDVNQRTTIALEVRLEERAGKTASPLPQPEVASVPKPKWFDAATRLSTGNNLMDSIVLRSVHDLQVLLTEFHEGWVPAAGLPRFGVPFGRDCLVTGLETLLWNHQFSRDVLRFLAKRQGKEENPWNYEQPGKIMHELHTGELARLKEVPFGLFYGSVDSTVLFLVLGAEHLRWTGDLDLYRELKDNYRAAWDWIDKYGDIDGSGYVQYQAHTPPKLSTAALTVGLFNQGWKDSARAVMYSNGTMVTDHPISLAEVQGELYRALMLWSELYASMPESEGMADEAPKLRARAQRLRDQFNHEFWMGDKGFYAMALDGGHRHVDTVTSNPGQCLWSRIIDLNHAPDLARALLGDSMFNGWGIRTMSSDEPAYNPFSYHDGSVWPFDNAIIAAGLKKYGFIEETQQVFDGLLDASLYFEYRRWPEVFCGVGKTVGGVLARQPDASRPQAWSAGAIFLLLQTLVGIAPRPFSTFVDITPALPAGLDEIVVENLSISGGILSLRLVRENNAVLMEIMENSKDLDIVIHPASRMHYHPHGKDKPAVSQ